MRRPANCKTNCPACARICPEAAIMFPKLEEAPINGAAIEDEAAVRGAVKVNVEKMLGDDPYAALAARSKRRRLQRDGGSAQALREREAHLRRNGRVAS